MWLISMKSVLAAVVRRSRTDLDCETGWSSFSY
jgi:hypothetical protein